MEKKSERLEVRLGFKEKQDFSEACEIQGDTPSGAIRRFISGYIRRSDRDVFSEVRRRIISRHGPRIVGFSLVIGFSIAAVWAGYHHITRPSDSEIFASRDVNKDDQLTRDELADGTTSESLLRIMDIDDSGGITRDEFQSKGRMVYTLSGPKNDQEKQYRLRDGERINLIKFHFEKESLKCGTYQSVETHLENVDRVVHWHEGGGVSVLEGPVEVNIGSEMTHTLTYK